MNEDEDEYEAEVDRRKLAGLVDCDDSNCTAKEEPETLEEYKVALDHARYHSWLSGCSHGN